MATYKNKVTGAVISVEGTIEGADWVEFDASKKPKGKGKGKDKGKDVETDKPENAETDEAENVVADDSDVEGAEV